MIIFDNYKIEKIKENDASDIHHLMVSNAKRFQRFFPKTLEANLTLVSANVFARQKVKQFDNSEEFLFTIKKDEDVVGLVYIKELDWKKKQGEFAYCLDKKCESNGVMTGAVKRLSVYAFDRLGLETLQIIAHISNIGSIKVAKKCNFKWQRTLLKEHIPPKEDPLDMELYELTKS